MTTNIPKYATATLQVFRGIYRAVAGGVVWLWRTTGSDKLKGAIAGIGMLVSSIIGLALVLRFSSPMTFIDVKDFEVSANQHSPGTVGITGPAVASIIQDHLSAISYISKNGTYYTSAKTHSQERSVLQAEGLSFETEVTSVSVWGIPLGSLLTGWYYIRANYYPVNGEMLTGDKGTPLLVADVEVDDRPLSFQISLDKTDPESIERACGVVAEEIVRAIAPQTLGRSFLYQRRYLEASEAFRSWMARNPKDAAPHFYLAWSYVEQAGATPTGDGASTVVTNQEFQAAEDEYRKSLELSPNDPESINGIGYVYLTRAEQTSGDLQKSLLKQAIDSSERANSIRNDPTFLENIGVAYSDSGDSSKAISYFERALSLDPDFSGAWYNMAITLEDMPPPSFCEATANCLSDWSLRMFGHCLEFVRSRPFFFIHKQLLPTCQYLNNPVLCQRAMTQFAYEQAIRSRPDLTAAWVDFAGELIDGGSLQSAETILLMQSRAVGSLVPSPSAEVIGRLHANLGRISMKRADLSVGNKVAAEEYLNLAVEHYSKALTFFPKTLYVENRAYAYHQLGEKDLACRDFVQAITLKSKDEWALKEMADLGCQSSPNQPNASSATPLAVKAH